MHAVIRYTLALSAVLATLAGGPVTPAGAVPVALPQNIGAGGGTWLVWNTGGTDNGLPVGGTSDGSPGLAVVDAHLATDGDAFDYALEVWVDDAIFVAPALVDLDVASQTLTAGPVLMSSLNVTVQYQASGIVGATLRTLASFQNPNAVPVTVTVKWVSNVGSDAATTVEGTATGNTTFTQFDAWGITSDNVEIDAVNTFVLFGPSAGARSPRVTPSALSATVFTVSGTQGVIATYAVTVPPGRTRRLLFFNQISSTVEQALRQVATFTETHANVVANVSSRLADLTAIQRSEILNWDFLLKETSGDFNGDGRADIMTGTGLGGAAHIRVFSFPAGAIDPVELFNFFAFDPGFTGGVRIAACDLNGDGVPDIVAGAGPGGGAHVRTFDGVTLAPLPGTIGSFFPYPIGYVGGTFVACNDVNGDGIPDIVTGTGVGGGPHVRVWSGLDGAEIVGFFPYDPGFTGGVFVGP
jgi:hypothetical protein